MVVSTFSLRFSQDFNSFIGRDARIFLTHYRQYIRLALPLTWHTQYTNFLPPLLCSLFCSYAQLGAGYAVSDAATATVARAHAEMKTFMNAGLVGETVLGGSTSQLMDNLGDCYSRILGPGDEVGLGL